MYFLCDVVDDSGTPDPLETLDIGWFRIDQLPPLSTTRILESQISMMHQHWLHPDQHTVFY